MRSSHGTSSGGARVFSTDGIAGSNDDVNLLDICNKLHSEIFDMKIQMKTITDYLSPSIKHCETTFNPASPEQPTEG